MLYPSASLGFNGLEILCVGLVLFAIALFGARLGWSRRETLSALVLVAPVLVLTAAEATQFMTMDERAISYQILDPRSRAGGQLSLGAFVTGILVALPVARICEIFRADATTVCMFLKAVWWLLGNGIVIALSLSLLRLRDGRRLLDPISFAVVFTGLAILPTTQLALKTINYDLLSFGLSVLALLYLLRAVLRGNSEFFWAALVSATLAAQEKLLAGPILLLVIVAASIGTTREEKPIAYRVVRAVSSAGRNLAVSLALTGSSLAIYCVLSGSPFGSDWSLVLGPISSWTWIPLGTVVPIETILRQREWIALATSVALFCTVAALAAVRPIWLSVWRRPASISCTMLARSIFVFACGIFSVGLIGALSVQAYWAPYHPTVIGELATFQKLNGAALHIGATSYPAHLYGIVLYAIAVVVVATPSAIWAIGVAGFLIPIRRSNEQDRFIVAVTGLLLGASLLLPIAAALTGMPFAHRYFNLSIAFLAGGLLVIGISSFNIDWLSRQRPARIVAAAGFIAICCAEAAPFRPLFAAFRPFWLSYADAKQAEPGRLNASWMGWGEEIMTGGKMLEAACLNHSPVLAGVPCSRITLYVIQSGLWLPGPQTIKLVLDNKLEIQIIPDSTVFYMVNRLYLIQGMEIPQITPDFAVSYRGYVLAWIYRGDRLAESGYRFRLK